MYTVGLTGQIACGKSSVARELQKLGATVINADEIGREIAQTAAVLRKLKAQFGRDIVLSNGSLDRRKLAARAFKDPHSTSVLNSIVHPALLAELRRQMKRHSRLKRKNLLVVDAALIFDWRLERELDVVIVVDSTRKNQLQRLQRQGIDREDALRRISRQIPKYRLRRKADAVIHNNGSLASLVQKTWRLYARLVRHSGQKFD